MGHITGRLRPKFVKQLTVDFTEDQMVFVRGVMTRNGTSASDVIRCAVDMWKVAAESGRVEEPVS